MMGVDRTATATERPTASQIAEALRRGDSVTVNQRRIVIDSDLVWGTDEYGLEVLVSMCSCESVGQRCIDRAIKWVTAKLPEGSHPAETGW